MQKSKRCIWGLSVHVRLGWPSHLCDEQQRHCVDQSASSSIGHGCRVHDEDTEAASGAIEPKGARHAQPPYFPVNSKYCHPSDTIFKYV